MKDSKLEEIFKNRAEIKEAERVICDNCAEQVVFFLKDSKNNKFSVGMTTILECLAFAISNGDLPKLPVSWLCDVDDVYETNLANNGDICYHDLETFLKRQKNYEIFQDRSNKNSS